jgi:hypothetical protein
MAVDLKVSHNEFISATNPFWDCRTEPDECWDAFRKGDQVVEGFRGICRKWRAEWTQAKKDRMHFSRSGQ